MKIKNLLAVMAAVTLTASAAAVYPAIAVREPVKVTTAEPVTEPVKGNESGLYKGYTYSSWGNSGSGVSMKLGNNGTFSCDWQNAEQAEFKRGTGNIVTMHEYETVKLDVEASIKKGNSYLIGETFTYHDQGNDESKLCLVLAYSGLDILSKYEPIAENSSFIMYKIKENVIDTENSYCSSQIFMLYKDGENKRDIDISKDITEDMRIMYEILGDNDFVTSDPELCICGFKGEGYADVTKNEITVIDNKETVSFDEYANYKRGCYNFRLRKSEGASGTLDINEKGIATLTWDSKNDDEWAYITKTVDTKDMPQAYKEGFYTVYSMPFIKALSSETGSYWRTKQGDEIYVIDFKYLSRFQGQEHVASIYDNETGEVKYRVYVNEALDSAGVITKQYWIENLEVFKHKAYYGVINDEINNITEQLRKQDINIGDIVEAGIFAGYRGSCKGSIELERFTTRFETKRDMYGISYDIRMLQDYLLGKDVKLEKDVDYDENDDGVIDVYDLIAMRKRVISISGIEGLQEIGGNAFPDGGTLKRYDFDDINKVEVRSADSDKYIPLTREQIKQLTDILNKYSLIDMEHFSEKYSSGYDTIRILYNDFYDYQLISEIPKIRVWDDAIENNDSGWIGKCDPDICKELREFIRAAEAE